MIITERNHFMPLLLIHVSKLAVKFVIDQIHKVNSMGVAEL